MPAQGALQRRYTNVLDAKVFNTAVQAVRNVIGVVTKQRARFFALLLSLQLSFDNAAGLPYQKVIAVQRS